MSKLLRMTKADENGRVGVPILLWIAGVPLGVVFLLWLFCFRGP
jgi:hypothetical protein